MVVDVSVVVNVNVNGDVSANTHRSDVGDRVPIRPPTLRHVRSLDIPCRRGDEPT